MSNLKFVQYLYDKRANENRVVDASGQWGKTELVPIICNKIIKKIKLERKHTVLELGCGGGVLGSYLIMNCFYIGIDISLVYLKKFNHDYLAQAITSLLPFKKNYFDRIVMNSVSMYLSKDLLNKTFDEIKRVAKSDAIIFLGDNVVDIKNELGIRNGIKSHYIDFRKKFKIGKWSNSYEELHSKILVKKFYEYNIIESKSCTSETKNEFMKHDNNRIDFIIKPKKSHC